MLYDSHCHIFHEYYSNFDKVIKNFENNGVKYVINNAVNYETILEVLETSKKYKNILAAIGYQPEEINSADIDFKIIENNIPNIVAIGEIGLDMYYSKKNINNQIYVFEKQLEIAEKYNKPVIIHSRAAFDLTIDILKKYKVKGVWHCFTGNIDEARRIIDLGFKLGIGGILTFKNSDLGEVIKIIDLNNIVLETDSPYLSPSPLRGKKNEPANIVHIFKKICEIKNIDENTASKILNNNMKEIFDI